MKRELEPALVLARELARDELPEFLGSLEEVRATAMARLTAPAPQVQQDELLNVKAAAARLSISADWLYRSAGKLPFAVRVGRRLLFSRAGLEKFIQYESVRRR